MGLFIYYMMENNKKHPDIDMSKIKYLCSKEPLSTYFMGYIHAMFPNARFVYMVRDGRDMAYSLMRRLKQGTTFNNFYRYLSYWNEKNKYAWRQCQSMGGSYCHLVKYEQLVGNPEPIIRGITRFLGISWSDDLLHHDRYLNGNKIALSKHPMFEAVQKKPIYTESIGKWRGKIRGCSMRRIHYKIDMLKKFNYY